MSIGCYVTRMFCSLMLLTNFHSFCDIISVMDVISIKDFQKLDIRIGTIVEAEVPKWSHWVMKMLVDLGPDFAPNDAKAMSGKKATTGEGTRTIFAGIMHFYKPEDLVGKQFPFIVNLEPKKIGPEGGFSQGMMLMAVEKSDKAVVVVEGEEEFERPILFKLSKKVPNGTKVM